MARMASALDVPTLMLTPKVFAFALISCIFINSPTYDFNFSLHIKNGLLAERENGMELLAQQTELFTQIVVHGNVLH
jgi:hypothetical protein